jgi:hypothetical protein
MRRVMLAVLLFLSLNLWAQNINPGTDPIFRANEVASIYLILTPEAKAFLFDPANVNSEDYFPATFRMVNTIMDTLLQLQVGIRLRGNTSRYQLKKAFKIDFREYSGGKFFGYKKFNLKPNVNDPSLVREPRTLQYYREMNVAAARSHPVKLFMNDEYMGIYMNIEQIDDEFVQSRFGHEQGYLYKCRYGANLTDNGQVFDAVLFESEINTLTDTRTEMDHFIKVLNNTSDANFQTEIEKVLQVDRYIRQMAVEALLGHWDAYSYNMNNFYLYYNGQTHLVEFIPYDTDNTWGIDWVGINWGTRDLNQWAKTNEPRPLTKRILQVPAYKQFYIGYLRELIETYFNEAYLLPILDSYKELLSSSVSSDTYFVNAFGFTYSDFLNSFNTGMTNHVKYGIKQYLNARTASAIQQIPAIITNVSTEVSPDALFPNPSREPRAYYYSNTTSSILPVVYTSLGNRQSVEIERIDDTHTKISLPLQASTGLYLIQIDGKIFRWIYRE